VPSSERSEFAFLAKSTTVKSSLLRLAEATRKLMFVKDPETGRPIYEDDHWLKQLDWTPKKARWTSLQTVPDIPSDVNSNHCNDPSASIQDSKKMIPAWFATVQRSLQGDTCPIALDSPLAALLFKVKFYVTQCYGPANLVGCSVWF